MIETLVRTIHPEWRYEQSGTALVKLQTNIDLLPTVYGVKEVDDERIVDYVVYQIYCVRNMMKFWRPENMFSHSSITKFKNQYYGPGAKPGINFYIDQWLNEVDLTRGKLLQMIAKPKESPLRKMVYMPSEEPIKRRWFNTPEGMALCGQSTTGWSPLSEACKECKNWVECGKRTAKKYPELMRFRKEVYYAKK